MIVTFFNLLRTESHGNSIEQHRNTDVLSEFCLYLYLRPLPGYPVTAFVFQDLYPIIIFLIYSGKSMRTYGCEMRSTYSGSCSFRFADSPAQFPRSLPKYIGVCFISPIYPPICIISQLNKSFDTCWGDKCLLKYKPDYH